MEALSPITTERLVLTFPDESDLQDIHQACQDPLIQAYTQCPSPYTMADAEWFVRQFSPALQAEGTAVWTIRTLDGAFVGVVDFHGKQGRSAELGYWLAPDQRGHGYVVEAAQAVCGLAHEHLGLDFVFARVEESNVPSLTSLQEIGFTVHALVPGSIFMKGTHRDAYYGTLWLTDDPPASAIAADPLEQVRHFHTTFGLPAQTSEVNAAVPATQTRWQLIAEEFCELLEALHGQDAVAPVRSALADLAARPFDLAFVDTVAAADALADSLYVLYGMAVETGIPIRQVFAEVHRANMSKLGTDGRPVLRTDGKVLKGPNYRAPDVRGVLFPISRKPADPAAGLSRKGPFPQVERGP